MPKNRQAHHTLNLGFIQVRKPNRHHMQAAKALQQDTEKTDRAANPHNINSNQAYQTTHIP